MSLYYSIQLTRWNTRPEAYSQFHLFHTWSLFITTGTDHQWEYSSWSCVCIRPSIQAHISVNAGRNFFNLGKMMSCDPGLMPIWFHFLMTMNDDDR